MDALNIHTIYMLNPINTKFISKVKTSSVPTRTSSKPIFNLSLLSYTLIRHNFKPIEILAK